MGHEPEGQDHDRLPDEVLWNRYHAKDPRAYAKLWSRASADLSREAIRMAGGDEARAEAALRQVKERLGMYEFQATYDPERPWIEWVKELLREVMADLDYQDLPEEELERRYQKGDPAAFRALWFVRRRADLVRLAWKLSFHDEETRDEILSATQAKLQRPGVYELYDPTRHWLHWAKAVMHKVAIDLHRRRSRDNIQSPPFDADLVVSPVRLDIEALAAALDDCLRNLLEAERELINLYFHGGMGWGEAAMSLGGHNAVWAHRTKQRALSKLRDCLKRKGYTDED
jgi:DNA-directed RNA polymerase specialized sigma24 family protein